MQSSRLPSSFRHFLYVPPGGNSSNMGDIDVITHDGVIHLFHVTFPNLDLIGHATSHDGFTWKTEEPALYTGKVGKFDDDMLWTMHVIRNPRGKGFLMYYTGCGTREHGQVQRVGLATSDDLYTWKRYSEEPILEAKKPHYLSDMRRVGFVSFRDPYVFENERGKLSMFVVARAAKGKRFRSGVVAHAESDDGLRWKLLPPAYAPEDYEDLEVPSVFHGKGKCALFFNEFNVGRTYMRLAKKTTGPWRRGKVFEPLSFGNVVFRFCKWQGKTLLYNWIMRTNDAPRRIIQHGAVSYVLTAPKEIRWGRDGEPIISSFEGWSQFNRGKTLHGRSLGFSGKDWNVGTKTLKCGTQPRREVLTKMVADDFILEGIAKVKNPSRVEILFRADPAADELYSIELDFVRQLVGFHSYEPSDSSVRRYKLRQPVALHSAHVPLAPNSTYDFRLVAAGEYIEFSLDGRVIISAASYRRERGRLGFAVLDGQVVITSIILQPLKLPYNW